MQVSIDVRGKRTLEESLDFYVQGELMEGENQYLCEGLGRKVVLFSMMSTIRRTGNGDSFSGDALDKIVVTSTTMP